MLAEGREVRGGEAEAVVGDGGGRLVLLWLWLVRGAVVLLGMGLGLRWAVLLG